MKLNGWQSNFKYDIVMTKRRYKIMEFGGNK